MVCDYRGIAYSWPPSVSEASAKIKARVTFDAACVRIPHDLRGFYDDPKGT